MCAPVVVSEGTRNSACEDDVENAGGEAKGLIDSPCTALMRTQNR